MDYIQQFNKLFSHFEGDNSKIKEISVTIKNEDYIFKIPENKQHIRHYKDNIIKASETLEGLDKINCSKYIGEKQKKEEEYKNLDIDTDVLRDYYNDISYQDTTDIDKANEVMLDRWLNNYNEYS